MHVAVLGAGYAGITLIRKLERSLPESVELTLVDERDTHLVQHFLHRVVREPALGEKLTVPLEDCCRRATIRQATVESVEVDEGRTELNDGTLTYDVGAVCLGARTAYYDLPGVRASGLPLKRLRDAERIREEFLQVCESGGCVVVGGAGLSGVQIAGELAELAREKDAGTIVEIILVEQESSVAPEFPEPFREAIAAELDRRNVQVRTETTVESADEETLAVSSGVPLPYDLLVWTGGIAGQPALADTRPRVRSTLRLGQRTFGLGDAVRVIDDKGSPVPATAQTAVRQASVAAENVEALVEGDRSDGFEPRLSRYTYSSPGWVVTVGNGTVAQVGSRVVRGAPAKALKTTIGVQHLAGVGAIEDAIELATESFGRNEETS